MKLTAISLIATAAVASAQSGSPLNPALPPTCETTLLQQLSGGDFISSCGLQNLITAVIAAGGSRTPTTEAQSYALASKLINQADLDLMCSDKCNSAITTFGSTVTAACGTTPLLNPTSVADGASSFKNLQAGDLPAIITYARKGFCVKDNNTYCAIALLAAVQAKDSKQMCTPCAAKEYDALKDTSSLPTYAKATVDPTLADAQKTLASCPAGSLGVGVAATGGSTTPSSGSHLAGSAAVGIAAGVASFILA
ncbi:uncharacterized protein EV422DRAFT_514075 [Fimicolochytrium jonesii]|uniref:uncharacterized protein n=1 Tax=Fimicolochytrium jonesii TaxID=1396493 RepID=UPI0022FE7978|nr:uncharacterized protein EV422DRAFT_514075 [Fimicolochytrium jonesii]KAI8825766.1 hypothetical protein EV422DRAFT_514075 [Fimicolochytrium jonesii]